MFAFYDRSARPEFVAYRACLERWLAELPAADAAKLVSQMQKGDDLGFESGVVELVMHASFIRLGYLVSTHPELSGNNNRPDLLLKNASGKPLALVEITTINPPSDDVADENREAQIYDCLNRVRLPEDMRLDYQVEKRGTDSPSLKPLAADVETWARKEASTVRSGGIVERLFSAGGWIIKLRLIAGFGPRPGGRQIAFSTRRRYNIDTTEPAKPLMKALDLKATRYGDLALPFVLVVADRTRQLAYLSEHFVENVMEGLFGPITTRYVSFRDGSQATRECRLNGFWMRNGRPDHTGVSAVLVFPRADIWNLRNERWQPLLVRNPFAIRPLTQDTSLPWNELVVCEEEIVVQPGRIAGDILELPDPWPPEH